MIGPSQRSVLVLANVKDRRNFAIIAEDRDAFAGKRKNRGTLFGDPIDFASFNKTVGASIDSCPVDPSLAKSRCNMERDHCCYRQDPGIRS
jgi:hypothetical protein